MRRGRDRAQDRQGPRDHGQGGDHLHRRTAAGCSPTPPTPTSAPATGWRSPTGGRTAQRHGDGAVPSDRPALHRHPDNRGGPRRGRLARSTRTTTAILQDYDLGKPTPTPVFRSMELGPARPRLASDRRRDGEGPRHPRPVRRRRPSGSAPSRRAQDRDPVADGARAVPQVRKSRSGARAYPHPPGDALHDGRRAHRH